MYIQYVWLFYQPPASFHGQDGKLLDRQSMTAFDTSLLHLWIFVQHFHNAIDDPIASCVSLPVCHVAALCKHD